MGFHLGWPAHGNPAHDIPGFDPRWLPTERLGHRVGRKWRSQLEPYNFADIRVRPSNLVEFASMTRRSRALVRYIWFCVELNEYEYCACWWHDSVNTDHWLIRAALAGLFSILSTWEASENLILDISVYSPSDKDHWFKYLTFLPDIPSGDEVTQMELDKYYDELHESASGVPYSATPSGAILRSFRTTTQYSPLASEFNWLEGLPMVPAVTSLRVRQQSRWRWLSPSLGPMLACFPRLEEIHYEPWRNWGHNQGTDDIGNEILLYMLPRFIKNLKRVVIFENFNQQYPAIIQRESTLFPSYCDSVRKPCPGAGEKMAIASLGLGHLAASFMVDARHFFAAIEPDWRWPQLMSLVLTSTCLRPGERRTAKIEALLRRRRRRLCGCRGWKRWRSGTEERGWRRSSGTRRVRPGGKLPSLGDAHGTWLWSHARYKLGKSLSNNRMRAGSSSWTRNG
ncbi:hypothetical protein PG987_009870 [Apiospora arundinis]